MTDVWVVRDSSGSVEVVTFNRDMIVGFPAHTIEHHALLTPAHAAVIAAAIAWEDVEALAYHMKQKQDAEGALVRAVDALKAALAVQP